MSRGSRTTFHGAKGKSITITRVPVLSFAELPFGNAVQDAALVESRVEVSGDATDDQKNMIRDLLVKGEIDQAMFVVQYCLQELSHV